MVLKIEHENLPYYNVIQNYNNFQTRNIHFMRPFILISAKFNKVAVGNNIHREDWV
jgi:hypothetical protein